jgi:hypothetical protein
MIRNTLVASIFAAATLAVGSGGSANIATAASAQGQLAPDMVRAIQRSPDQRGYRAGAVSGGTDRGSRDAAALNQEQLRGQLELLELQRQRQLDTERQMKDRNEFTQFQVEKAQHEVDALQTQLMINGRY